MAPQDGVCQLSGHDQRVFTYVLTLNDSSEQSSRCMASVVVMHCPVTPLALLCVLYVVYIERQSFLAVKLKPLFWIALIDNT